MAEHFDELDIDNLSEENKRLKLEIRKLTRQLNLANDNMQKYKSVTSAKENLSAVIAVEKSKQDKQLQIIMENNPDVIFLLDSSMNFLLSTKSFLTFTGIPALGLLQHKSFRQVFAEFSDDKWLDRIESVFKRSLETNEVHSSSEKLCIGAGRDASNYSVNVIPFAYSGKKNDGILVIFHDITEHIEMENKLKEALNRANIASKAKGDFLSNMSHEMRTPMNAIIGMTAIGKKADDIEKKNRALDKIENAASHLLGIINDVLDMAKIEADKLELVSVEYSLEEMLQKVATVVNFRVDEKRQQFTMNIADDVPRHIIGDDQRLAQVITNLLSNAVKFTPEGGSISLKVLLSGEPCESGKDCELRVEVTDTGIGISPEHIGRLFLAFEQAESGTSREYGGTGLGLVISKRIVELMDGKIWVESALGKGSRFIFTIKARRGSMCFDASPDDTADSDHFEGKRLLLAEDVEINREILIELLDGTGLIIDCAENGQEALDMIKAAPDKYDIVFMDIQMPKMDGLEATRRIRAANAGMPIVAMTANVFKDDIEACLAAGMNDHLGKPLNIDHIFEKLRKYLYMK